MHMRRSIRPASSFVCLHSSPCTMTLQCNLRHTDLTQLQQITLNSLSGLRRSYCSAAPLNVCDKHSAMYEKVLKAARRGLQKRYKDRRTDIIDLIDSLLSLNMSKYDITWLLAETPELLSYCQDFHDRVAWLAQQGFVGSDLAQLLHKDPG